ncbi:RHS repeat-associated core domain-containing protein [Pseudomonas serbica]
MRFTTPDDVSPFDVGGINAYAYCGNDPVNNFDPSGKSPFWRPWLSSVTVKNPLKQIKQTTVPFKKTISTVAQPVAHAPQSQVTLQKKIPKSQLKAKQRPSETPFKTTADTRNLKIRAEEYDKYISENPGNHPAPPSKYKDNLDRRQGELEEARNRDAPNEEINARRVNYLRALRTFKAQAMKAIQLTNKEVRATLSTKQLTIK